jgi:hypothetical protein
MPMTLTVSVFRYLWALPNTVVGLLFLPTTLQRGSAVRVVDGVLEIHGPLVATMLRHLPISGGAAAITFGHVVLGRNQRALDVTRTHERIHVRQCERWGPAFIPAYLLAGAWAGLRGRGAYQGNYFEREAYRCE